MNRLNGQLLTDSSFRGSTVSLEAIVNDKQTIGSDHRIESNHFPKVCKESIQTLSYKKLNKVQQQHWRALSIFPNQFDCAAAAALWGMKAQEEASTLLKVLEAEGLVVSLPSCGQNLRRYMLDEPVRLFASARLSGDEHEEALFRHAKHYKEVLQQAAFFYEQGGEALERGLALFEQEWPNIQAGQFWSTDYTAQNQKAAALCRDYQEVGGYMLLVGLDSEEWFAWQESALLATEYLDDSQRQSERAVIRLEELNTDVPELRDQQSGSMNADAEGLHAKAQRLAHEGARYVEEGQVELAIECYNEQLAMVRKLNDEQWEAKILYQLAKICYLLSEMPLAIELYQQSCQIMHKLADLNGEASTLIGLGNAYAELEEWQEAIGFYESCLQLLDESESVEPGAEAYLLEELGNAYELLGDLPRAITFYERQLACARELEENESLCRALGYLGKAYHNSGLPRRAIECLQQQVAIEQEGSNHSVKAKTLGFLGGIYAELGEYQPAIAYCQQQLSLVREQSKLDEEESTLWNLALAHHKAGQIPEAIEYYEQQLAITRLLGKAEKEMLAYEYLGLAYHKMGQVKQAIYSHQQQLTIAHQRKDWSSKARALEYLGLTYTELDQFPKAITYFEQQLTIVSMFENHQAEARALAYLANVYDLQNDGSRSIKLYEQALQLNRELKDKEEEASNLWHISLALYQQGKIERAISYAKGSLAIYEQLRAPQASKIRQQLKKWQEKGSLGTYLNAFKRGLRFDLSPAT